MISAGDFLRSERVGSQAPKIPMATLMSIIPTTGMTGTVKGVGSSEITVCWETRRSFK